MSAFVTARVFCGRCREHVSYLYRGSSGALVIICHGKTAIVRVDEDAERAIVDHAERNPRRVADAWWFQDGLWIFDEDTAWRIAETTRSLDT